VDSLKPENTQGGDEDWFDVDKQGLSADKRA